MTYLKICPQCGSTDITIPNAGLDFKMSVKDKCRNCGNTGNFPEVEESEAKKFRENLKKSP